MLRVQSLLFKGVGFNHSYVRFMTEGVRLRVYGQELGHTVYGLGYKGTD